MHLTLRAHSALKEKPSLGSSMGGYGAILASRGLLICICLRLTASRCFCVSPILPNVPIVPLFLFWRNPIKPTFGEATYGFQYVLRQQVEEYGNMIYQVGLLRNGFSRRSSEAFLLMQSSHLSMCGCVCA